MKLRLVKRLSIITLVGAMSIGSAITVNAANNEQPPAQMQEQGPGKGENKPGDMEKGMPENGNAASSSSMDGELKEAPVQEEANKGLKRFYEDEDERKEFITEEYINTDAAQELIDSVEDEELQTALQELLDAYQDALDEEKEALDSEDSTEEEIKSLHEAVLTARDALLDAMRDVEIDVDDIQEPEDEVLEKLLKEYEGTSKPEGSDEGRPEGNETVKPEDNGKVPADVTEAPAENTDSSDSASSSTASDSDVATDDIGTLNKIKQTLENALNALKSLLSK
ncbi:MAG: hypothetical protein K6A23_02105 [Butyrivibrio sp.]|nr:hypothetical protein [Butyrivibrio sp.]